MLTLFVALPLLHRGPSTLNEISAHLAFVSVVPYYHTHKHRIFFEVRIEVFGRKRMRSLHPLV